MNETIAKVMEFINNHTLILIGICVFLILVLIGYLIDNSVKSKRVRNDIKNPDQVPEVIKDAIIKKAELEKEEEKANTTIRAIEDNNTIDNVSVSDSGIISENIEQPQETVSNDISGSLDLDSTLNMNPEEINLESLNTVNDTDIIDDTKPEMAVEEQDNSFNIDIPVVETPDTNVSTDNLLYNDVETPTDPDYNIMKNVENNGYSNDKKLSEILLGAKDKTESIQKTDDSNIFSDNSSNIVVNNDVKKDDVQIETKENGSSDELDRIMRKLSAMNTNIEEDNYTNIF